MKKLLLFCAVIFCMVSVVMQAQSVAISPRVTPAGVEFAYTTTMLDSTGTHYSGYMDMQGYQPQVTGYNFPTYVVIGTGIKDTVNVFIQGRMIVQPKSGTGGPYGPGTSWPMQFTNWTVVDSAYAAGFNKNDSLAYFKVANSNAIKYDQLRVQVVGLAANRSNVTITVLAEAVKQYGIFKVQ